MNILFYQANFGGEVERMFTASDENNQKHFEMFQQKSLNIAEKIISMSNNFAEKEEWFAIRNLLEAVKDIDAYSKNVLLTFGTPFAIKFAYKNMQ